MKFGLQKASFVLLVLFSLGLFQLPGGIHQSQSVSRAAVLQPEVTQAEPAAAPKLAAVENYLRRLVSAGCPSKRVIFPAIAFRSRSVKSRTAE